MPRPDPAAPPAPGSIRARVAAAARAQGFTGRALSLACGGSPSRQHVSEYLAGRRDLTTGHADRLLAALGIVLVDAPSGGGAES